MSADTEAIRRDLAAAIDEGRDGDGEVLFAAWRESVARDSFDELVARGPSDLLCGPVRSDCKGTVAVDGHSFACPLAALCGKEGEHV